MKPNKKDILKDTILLVVESLRKDICQDANPDNNLTRAQAIKKLTEAYFMASKA